MNACMDASPTLGAEIESKKNGQFLPILAYSVVKTYL